jgi:membrane protein YqaA with SNARE-associated domain
MEIFSTIAAWLEATLLPYGGIGLMLLAICDSSFLSLPEVNDILVMTFSIRQPDQMFLFAGLTTLGSVIGCGMLFAVGRGGGGALLRRRSKVEANTRWSGQVRGWYERYGMLAVIVPSLLPPPTPFKVFVLSAGTFGISWTKFLVSVAIGRSIRYFTVGFLAVLYGDAAIVFVQGNYLMIGAGLVALIVVATSAIVLWQRRYRSREE